jgi:hypothetical protein
VAHSSRTCCGRAAPLAHRCCCCTCWHGARCRRDAAGGYMPRGGGGGYGGGGGGAGYGDGGYRWAGLMSPGGVGVLCLWQLSACKVHSVQRHTLDVALPLRGAHQTQGRRRPGRRLWRWRLRRPRRRRRRLWRYAGAAASSSSLAASCVCAWCCQRPVRQPLALPQLSHPAPRPWCAQAVVAAAATAGGAATRAVHAASQTLMTVQEATAAVVAATTGPCARVCVACVVCVACGHSSPPPRCQRVSTNLKPPPPPHHHHPAASPGRAAASAAVLSRASTGARLTLTTWRRLAPQQQGE